MQTIPTINVNLEQCNHAAKGHPLHAEYCSSRPILLPCPLPASVTFEVRLGECNCPAKALPGSDVPHRDYCPARPIRVSCSIGGKTWAESMVTDVDGPFWGSALESCRERWALVKALVLGVQSSDPFGRPVVLSPLEVQRDAVYAALADMARAEEVLNNAAGVSATALRACGASIPKRTLVLLAMAESDLAAYVDRLIEQVGVLP